METIFNRSLNEIIFENKNKVYGAFALRRKYKDNLVIALLFSAGFFGIIAFTAFNLNKNNIDKLAGLVMPDIDSVIVQEYHATIEQPIEPVIEKKKPVEDVKPPKSDDLNIEASDDKTVTDVKPNDLLTLAPKGVKDGDSAKTGNDIIIPVETKKDEGKEIVSFPDKFPEFDNLQRYIVDNVRYPEIAKEGTIEGTVYISFVVELDGTVSDVKAMNKIGGGCENEAIRVVKLMKNWKPGIFKGKPRRVPATLPIKFRLN